MNISQVTKLQEKEEEQKKLLKASQEKVEALQQTERELMGILTTSSNTQSSLQQRLETILDEKNRVD